MFERLYRHDGWGVGLIRAPIRSLVESTSAPEIEWLPLRKEHSFFADPFLIEDGGALYCFFEELSYRTNRGRISYIRIDEGDPKPPVVRDAIDRPYHLSYPYLFRHEGEVFCVPEAFQSGKVTLYAARSFPDGWYERATLLENFPGTDPTLFQHDNRWWMLCTDARSGCNSDLCAWYADDLFGPWSAHTQNPIKRDRSAGRPGGTPFVRGNRLYRPAQDCSVRYGGGLALCEILELTPTRFEERVVRRLAPDAAGPFPDGFHTASGCDAVTAVDGNRRYFEPLESARAIAEYARKALRITSFSSTGWGNESSDAV